MSKRKNPTPVESIAATGDAIATAAEDRLDLGETNHRGTEITENANSKPMESKAGKFIRLANRRVNNALKAIGHLCNLSNRASYEYTSEQVTEILAALDEATREVAASFAQKTREKNTFSL